MAGGPSMLGTLSTITNGFVWYHYGYLLCDLTS